MDWQSLRRQRLAKATSSHEQARRKGPLASIGQRISGIWNGFGESSLWEKTVIVIGIVVLAVMSPIAYFVFVGGGGADAGGQPPLAAAGPTATEAAIYVIDSPTSANPPTPTLEPTVVAPTPTTKPTAKPPAAPANRRDCDAIAGTAYKSNAERDWYLANCDDAFVVVAPPSSGPSQPTATASNTPTSRPPTPRPPTPRPPAPTATPTVFPSEAALLYHAVDWLARNTPGSEVAPGSCTVSPLTDSQWIVTCVTRPAGCQGVSCFDITTVTMCITSPTFTVWRC